MLGGGGYEGRGYTGGGCEEVGDDMMVGDCCCAAIVFVVFVKLRTKQIPRCAEFL